MRARIEIKQKKKARAIAHSAYCGAPQRAAHDRTALPAARAGHVHVVWTALHAVRGSAMHAPARLQLLHARTVLQPQEQARRRPRPRGRPRLPVPPPCADKQHARSESRVSGAYHADNEAIAPKGIENSARMCTGSYACYDRHMRAEISIPWTVLDFPTFDEGEDVVSLSRLSALLSGGVVSRALKHKVAFPRRGAAGRCRRRATGAATARRGWTSPSSPAPAGRKLDWSRGRAAGDAKPPAGPGMCHTGPGMVEGRAGCDGRQGRV